MARISELSKYQKAVLIFMLLLVLVYTVAYPATVAREGYLYRDTVLIPYAENGNTVYSGEIEGTQAAFTVSGEKAVSFQYGDKVYGPYTAKEDAAAIPQEHQMKDSLRGLELCRGEEVIFRGGVYKMDGLWWLINEDGSYADSGMITIISNGITTDENGNVIDPMEPSLSVLLDLIYDPELTHKGDWAMWFGGVFICIFTTITILFADELFRLSLMFKVHNADRLEPSDWEIASRYIAWTLLPVCAWILFALALR